MRKLELLAPAKNLQCGIAAIDHGADAVYIGAQSFGARHAAGNTIDDIRSLCSYAHTYAAKVYATVNTIIFDDEMGDARQLVGSLRAAGVDAILVQDMGLLSHFREFLCDEKAALANREGSSEEAFAFHASTQTDNRGAEKVQWLRSLGFKRVVLARELSLEEIRMIHQSVPDVELEVFVHGALCVSFSGQCYASQHCFQRSANRGECAQFCRLKFALEDSEGYRVENDAYYLSLKDMCQIDNLEQMIEAGAVSFKIEGRLKDETYVKNVVAAYSNRLDEIIKLSNGKYCRASLGSPSLSFTPDLRKSFNRGYTDYFLHGRKENVASFMTPKAIGETVGRIKEIRRGSFTVSGTASFANGDGLCYIDNDGTLQGFRVNRAEGNRLFPLRMPHSLKPGTLLYRNQDQEFDRQMARPTSQRTIPLLLDLRLLDNKTLRLTAKDTTDSLTSQVDLTLQELQEAQKPQAENIRRQLSKLGGTCYSCQSISLDERLDRVFVPSSMLADMRRKAINDLAFRALPTEETVLSGNESVALSGNGSTAKRRSETPVPTYRQAHLYNASNADAKRFYAERGIEEATSYESESPKGGAMLMQCRHCLRYSLGHCVKNGGTKPTWSEPLYLRLPDGNRFRLEFDCRNCQMNVYSVEA